MILFVQWCCSDYFLVYQRKLQLVFHCKYAKTLTFKQKYLFVPCYFSLLLASLPVIHLVVYVYSSLTCHGRLDGDFFQLLIDVSFTYLIFFRYHLIIYRLKFHLFLLSKKKGNSCKSKFWGKKTLIVMCLSTYCVVF